MVDSLQQPTPAPQVVPALLAAPAPLSALTTLATHLSVAERVARGKAARKECPRSEHARWEPLPERDDPVATLEAQTTVRLRELVPLRYQRMSANPFTFFRGAAAIMASDLATTVRSGLRAQICGDAHLANFGIFSSPERALIFDLNDFDETLPGPWEWDVKRLAASFEVAMRERGMAEAERRRVVLRAVGAYRETMCDFAERSNLGVWYARLDTSELLRRFKTTLAEKDVRALDKGIAKVKTKDSLRALDKLTVMIDGKPRIASRPPLIVPASELLDAEGLGRFEATIMEFLGNYRRSLPDDRKRLFDGYEFVQIARKVVGVGSVGMRSWIVLLLGRDTGDPLFLQLKQAESSVHERSVGRSRYRNHGRRVVEGQRLMQASSDVLLGWYKVHTLDGEIHDFYVRQLWDGKASLDVSAMPVSMFKPYAEACAWTLARAHARSGDPIAIAAYLGSSDVFDRACADFASTYAEQTRLDHAALLEAIAEGRIAAQLG